MAMARTFAEGGAKGMKPKRSLLFLWVTGEEKGLWGSRYFCQFPPIDITKVVADLNMDMISRPKPPDIQDPPPTSSQNRARSLSSAPISAATTQRCWNR